MPGPNGRKPDRATSLFSVIKKERERRNRMLQEREVRNQELIDRLRNKPITCKPPAFPSELINGWNQKVAEQWEKKFWTYAKLFFSLKNLVKQCYFVSYTYEDNGVVIFFIKKKKSYRNN